MMETITLTSEKIREEETEFGRRFYNPLGELLADLSLERQNDGIFCDSWYGYALNNELIAVMDAYYAPMVAESGCTKKLCDIREFKSAFDGISEWFVNDLMPRMIGAGLRYNALVMPQDIFAQLAAEYLVHIDHNTGYTNRMFGDYNEALNWLKSVA